MNTALKAICNVYYDPADCDYIVRLIGSTSTGNITKFEWTLFNVNIGNMANIAHDPKSPGPHPYKLTVYDDNGRQDNCIVWASFDGPTADIKIHKNICNCNKTVYLDGSDSRCAVTYAWYVDDEPAPIATTATATHDPWTAGVHKYALLINDKYNNADLKEKTVTIPKFEYVYNVSCTGSFTITVDGVMPESVGGIYTTGHHFVASLSEQSRGAALFTSVTNIGDCDIYVSAGGGTFLIVTPGASISNTDIYVKCMI